MSLDSGWPYAGHQSIRGSLAVQSVKPNHRLQMIHFFGSNLVLTIDARVKLSCWITDNTSWKNTP